MIRWYPFPLTGMCIYLDFLNRFRELLDENDSFQAVRLAGSMVAKYPSSLALREHWALALWHSGRFSEASDVLCDAEALGELSAYAQLIYIHCLARQGSRRDGLKRLQHFLSKASLCQQELERIARKFGEWTEFRLALEVCFHLTAINPTSVSARC